MPKDLQLHPCRVTLDDWLGPYDAYTMGARWNGWACPYFTKETAERMVEEWNAKTTPKICALYHPIADAFGFYLDGADEWDYFPGVTMPVDGQPLHLYAIGNGCWIWETVEHQQP